LWDFGDGDNASTTNPTHSYTEVGEYIVTLVAISNHGCMDTIQDLVNIQPEFTFYAPTAFTPGNNSHNDMFRVFGSGIDNNNFFLIIYDRWGEPVFESFNIEKSWDGRVREAGKIVPLGTYTWYCVYKDLNGIEHERTGGVTVIR